ncbi:MAG: FprA family A-type flavoprotein [Ancalomicrobiaceae bacterium]|nr:FprA family A-type flavoprotein [Ancalomicrobiaceae bacterium]
MIPVNITESVISFRSSHWDRKLFDELVPLPEGTTYNAYLVKGSEKTALIDTVYPPKTADFISALQQTGIETLDYIISNHGEHDHSGSIPAVLELFPNAKVVTNMKCRRFILDTLPVDKDAFITIKDGSTLSLGDKTLTFLMTPWVHWPDTMITYLEEDRIAFTCDFLGSHFATTDLFAIDEARVEIAAKRYYAEIMMPYRAYSKEALDRLEPLKLDFIAPGHGPVHARPEFITGLYRQWTADECKPTVVIPYLSMYESTATMVTYLVDRLQERGLSVRPINVVDLDSGELAMALVEASTVVFASPTVLSGAHPFVAYAALLANMLAPKTKFAAVVGSFGWEGTLPDVIQAMLPKLNVTFFEPVLARGVPREEAFAELDRLADDIARANFGGAPAAAQEVETA